MPRSTAPKGLIPKHWIKLVIPNTAPNTAPPNGPKIMAPIVTGTTNQCNFQTKCLNITKWGKSQNQNDCNQQSHLNEFHCSATSIHSLFLFSASVCRCRNIICLPHCQNSFLQTLFRIPLFSTVYNVCIPKNTCSLTTGNILCKFHARCIKRASHKSSGLHDTLLSLILNATRPR